MQVILFAGGIGTGKTTLSDMLYNYLSNQGFTSVKTSFASELKKVILKNIGIMKNKPYVTDKFFFLYEQMDFKFGSESVMNFIINEIIVNIYKDLGVNNFHPDLYPNHKKLIIPIFEIFNAYVVRKDFDEIFKMKYRKIAQIVGTEIGRVEIDKEYWTKKMENKISAINKSNAVDYVIIDDVRFKNEMLESFYIMNKIPALYFFMKRDKALICKSLNISELEYKNMTSHESENSFNELDIENKFIVIENNFTNKNDLLQEFFKTIKNTKIPVDFI